MAKAGMKRKKEEKTKTQLKRPKTAPGQHLPKGTNVTKTDFKVGKIVIPKQLEKSGEAGPVTKRKLGLKELLSKLTHYSQTVRFESLEGIKELVTGEQGGNLVQGNLSLLVSKLAPLTSDRERRVRRAAFAILQAILSQVAESKLEPLFPVLTAHLSCCLTHIDPAIQQDGLNLIDSLVTTVPSFIAGNFSKILPDCLEQISKRSVNKSKAGVSTNVSEKITALQWRTDVLKRVDQVLRAILSQLKSKIGSEKAQNCVKVEFGESVQARIYPMRPSSLCLSELVKKSGEDPMLEITDKIIPLILDSWVEATAETNKKRIGFLSNDVFPLLEHISGILEKLVTYSRVSGYDGDDTVLVRLKQKYFADLNSRLLSHLPYSNSSGKCNAQNILLSSVILNLAESLDANLLSRIIQTVGSPTTDAGERLKVFKHLLYGSLLDKESRGTVLTLLLDMSANLASGSEQRIGALKLLSDLAECDEELGSWLESLPSLLISAVDQSFSERSLVLETMLKFAQRRNTHLEQSFKLKSSALQDWSEGLEEKEKQNSKMLLSYIHQNYA